MGWLVGILVAVVALVLVRRAQQAREKAEADLHKIEGWCAELLATGKVPTTGPLLGVTMAEIVANMERIGTELTNARWARATDSSSLKTILSGMAQGVMVVDRGHTIRRVNPSFSRLLDINGDPLGHNVRRAFRDVPFDELVASVLKSGTTQTSEVSVPNSNPPRYLSVTATLIEELPGETSVLLICYDVTRLKKLEDVRREFVANVSHELRTPLAIFQGYVEALMDYPDMPPDERENVFRILKRHSTRLNALVEDLLVLARLESRVDNLNVEPIDPRSLLEDVVKDWQITGDKKGVSISAECAPDAPTFEADPLRMVQVLHNLADNAFKHTEAGGSIVLRATARDHGIELRVEDTGAGIPPLDVPHIFQRFYRADKARSREQGGTGLGLSIVKHIVQLHGGTVSAESTLGNGTSIVLQLPLSPQAATDPKESAALEIPAA